MLPYYVPEAVNDSKDSTVLKDKAEVTLHWQTDCHSFVCELPNYSGMSLYPPMISMLLDVQYKKIKGSRILGVEASYILMSSIHNTAHALCSGHLTVVVLLKLFQTLRAAVRSANFAFVLRQQFAWTVVTSLKSLLS